MKKVLSTNIIDEKRKKMTLNGYYNFLASQKTPLQDFICTASERCDVTQQTVRNWCLYGIKPQSYAHVKVLVELTGINEDELWNE